MAQDINGLIEKINQEGFEAAEYKARQIQSRAEAAARAVIEKAGNEAEAIINDAKKKCAGIEASTNALLKQAGRDLILCLKKEINQMLDNLIASSSSDALSVGEMTKIITRLIEQHIGAQESGVIITIPQDALETLEKGLFSSLKEELKKAITLKPSNNIRAGFTISYDRGKSEYDFTDKGFSEYIGSYLKPKLGALFKD